MIKQIILHTIVTEKRNIFFATITMAAILLVFSTLFTGTYTDANNYMRIDYGSAIGIGRIALFICMILSASRMMTPLKDRRSSIQFLMLPADNRDKFLARWIIGVVGYTMMFLVALVAADVLQALYNIALRYTTGSLTASFFSEIFCNGFVFFDNSSTFISGFVHGILWFLWFHAIYTLGSTFFRTHSFIKTSLLFLGVIILGSIIASCFMIPMVYSDRTYEVHFLVDPEIMSNITFYTFFIATGIGAYYWAYRRFCNKMIL